MNKWYKKQIYQAKLPYGGYSFDLPERILLDSWIWHRNPPLGDRVLIIKVKKEILSISDSYAFYKIANSIVCQLRNQGLTVDFYANGVIGVRFPAFRTKTSLYYSKYFKCHFIYFDN